MVGRVAGTDEELREWARLHDDYDLSRSRLVRGWLRGVNLLARPLARHDVSPHVVTAAGVATALAATVAPRRMAAGLVAVTAVLDGLDGAVAVQRGVTGRTGTVVDHVADRGTDVLFALALRRAGARRGTANAAAAVAVLFESARDVLRLTGHAPRNLVTAGERPMRVAAVVTGLAVAPTAGATAVAALSAAAGLRLVRAVSRREAGPGPAHP